MEIIAPWWTKGGVTAAGRGLKHVFVFVSNISIPLSSFIYMWLNKVLE